MTKLQVCSPPSIALKQVTARTPTRRPMRCCKNFKGLSSALKSHRATFLHKRVVCAAHQQCLGTQENDGYQCCSEHADQSLAKNYLHFAPLGQLSKALMYQAASHLVPATQPIPLRD